jgi:uncharacterized protein YraI
MKHRSIIPVAAAALLAIIPTVSHAALEASSFPRIRVLAGPNGDYPIVAHAERGTKADVRGCVEEGTWCEVLTETDRGLLDRGWVAASDLNGFSDSPAIDAIRRGNMRDVPVVSYNQTTYWNENYRDQPFYKSTTTSTVTTDNNVMTRAPETGVTVDSDMPSDNR